MTYWIVYTRSVITENITMSLSKIKHIVLVGIPSPPLAHDTITN